MNGDSYRCFGFSDNTLIVIPPGFNRKIQKESYQYNGSLLKTGVELTSQTSCVSDIGYHRQQTCQRNVGIVSQLLSETFRKRMSLDLLRRFPILVESLNRFVLHVIIGILRKFSALRRDVLVFLLFFQSFQANPIVP
jgi:hypothetical protein